MTRAPDAVVVGGGVVGCAVAWSLAREGVTVTLLERDDIAGQASGAAAGMLLPYGESAARGPLLEWGERSLDALPAVCAELREHSGIDPELEVCGALTVAGDAAAEALLRERLAIAPHAGLEWLDEHATRDAEPALRPGLRGALWSPREAHVRSPLLTRAYAEAARALGADIERGVAVTRLLRAGSRVVGLETRRGRVATAAVVLCGGAWTPELAPLALPIEPVRGQILQLDDPAPGRRSMLLEGDLYLVAKRDGSLVVGATEERAGFDRRVTAAGLGGLAAAACRLLPSLADAGFRSAWAGLRPATPDGLPAIGAVPGWEGLYVAAGHFRNGVLLSAVTGRLIAAHVLGKEPFAGCDPFAPERFSAP